MYKPLFFLVIFAFYSCDKLEKYQKNQTKHVVSKLNNLNAVRFDFKGSELIRILNFQKGYEIIFYDGNINRIRGICITKSKNTIEDVNFNVNGDFVDYSHDYPLNESFVVDNSKDFMKYSVFKKYAVSEYLERVIYYSIDKKTKDTFNYHLYKPVSGGYQIYTDVKEFTFNPKIMDSMLINYVEHDLKEKDYYSPEKNMVLPNLKGMNEKEVRNSLFVPTKSAIVVGTLWTFFKKDYKDPFAYQFVYMNGDIMSRIKKYEKQFKSFPKRYNSKMINNKEYLADILESGYYKLSGNKLVRDKTGE